MLVLNNDDTTFQPIEEALEVAKGHSPNTKHPKHNMTNSGGYIYGTENFKFGDNNASGLTLNENCPRNQYWQPMVPPSPHSSTTKDETHGVGMATC